jgi:hypothetical protein
MKDWIPLFQSLVWPAFIAGLLVWLIPHILPILAALQRRISEDDTIELSTSGIKLSGAARAAELKAEGLDPVRPPQLPNTVYLVHEARKKARGSEGSESYRVRIFLDADSPDLLNRVVKVVYHLHPSFEEPVVTKSNRDDAFQLGVNIWGEFNMYAEIHFDDTREPLEIERYINL